MYQAQSTDQHQHSSPRNRRKLFSIIGVVAVVVIAFCAWAFSSNDATVTNGDPNNKTAAPLADKTYDGTYMSFQYHGGYSGRSVLIQSAQLENYVLTAPTTYDKHIAITVTPSADNNPASDANYNLRKSQPALYSSRQVTVDGGSAIVWDKADGTEETAFITHDHLLAVLSFDVAGTNDPGDLQTEASQVLASFHWKR